MAQVPDIDVSTVSVGGSAYTVPFIYQNRSAVFVEVDGVSTAFTWINDGNISITPAPAAGAIVRRYRSTSALQIRHDYRNGVPFTPKNIAENNDQLLFVVQEATASADTALTAANSVISAAQAAAEDAAAAEASAAGAAAEASAAAVSAATANTTANNALALIESALEDSASELRMDLAGTGGATLIGFSGSTVADTLQKLQARVSGEIHVSEFGLVGDGTDETTKVQNAITTAASQRKVLVGDRMKTYKITSQINGASNCYVKDLRLDASAMTGTKHALVFAGTQLSTGLLGFNAVAGSYLVRMQAGQAAPFSPGDWALLTVENTSVYPGSGVARGEWVQIRSKGGDDITITTPLVQSYSTANVAYLRKYNMPENIVLDNVRVVGSNTHSAQERGICFRFAKDFEVKNCVVEGIDHYALELYHSIRFAVHHNRFRNPYYDGTNGAIFYAIALLNACQYFIVHNNYASQTRHLAVTTGFTGGGGAWGQCMFGIIHDNVAEDCMSGGTGRSYAYEMHGTGQHLLWANNIANGCHSFMRIEGGSDSQIIGGGCNGYGFQGIIIGGAGQTVRNVDIRGVHLKTYTGEVGGLAAGIRIEYSTLMENLTIDGVKMDGAAVAGTGAAISIGGAATSRNNRIKNLQASAGTVESAGAAVVTASSVTGFSFEGCDLFGWRNGYQFPSGTSKLVVKGGTVENFAAADTGWGVYSNGDRNIIQGVHIRNLNTAMRFDAASTNNLAVNNTITDCIIAPPSNAGTGNTVTPNYVV